MPKNEWSMGTEGPVTSGLEQRFKTEEPVRRQQEDSVRNGHHPPSQCSQAAGRQLQFRGGGAGGRRSEEAILKTKLMKPRPVLFINVPLISAVDFCVCF